MAHPIVKTPRLKAAMERIRPITLALPGVVEKVSHGSPTFFTADGRKGRTFASVHDEREWGEGRLCLWAAGPKELQEALIADGPERYFVPPYVGHRGWVGLRLDLPAVDWDEVAGVIEDSYAFIAER
ncbi:MAG TPA: MmcQ/YjbR family DNA-binding protein [Solirubrobacterales bacterium]|nr:MmcQ/YjbR family DNA-binding protein [Solirubrobacterales bacterium]